MSRGDNFSEQSFQRAETCDVGTQRQLRAEPCFLKDDHLKMSCYQGKLRSIGTQTAFQVDHHCDRGDHFNKNAEGDEEFVEQKECPSGVAANSERRTVVIKVVITGEGPPEKLQAEQECMEEVIK